jgi:hypothetical protein
MSEHISLMPLQTESLKSKTLREELLAVAENAVRQHIKEKAAQVQEAQNDSGIYSKLEEILAEVKKKNINLQLERETLEAVKAELS